MQGKDGRAYRYQTRLSREQYAAELMEEVLDGSANRPVALLHFVEQVSPQEAAQLRDALNDLGGEVPAP